MGLFDQYFAINEDLRERPSGEATTLGAVEGALAGANPWNWITSTLYGTLSPVRDFQRTMQRGGNPTIPELYNMAFSIMPGGMANTAKVAPGETMLGTFGGVLSKKADLDALLRAEQMERAGATVDDIRMATGWERGAEGAWKYEIDDSLMRVKTPKEATADLRAERDQTQETIRRMKRVARKQKDFFPDLHKSEIERLTARVKEIKEALKDPHGPARGTAQEWSRSSFMGRDRGIKAKYLVDHPELFEAYPELGEIITRSNERLGGAAARTNFRSDGGVEFSFRDSPAQQSSSLLHEFSHPIQEIEGFAQGASPGFIRTHKDPVVREAWRKALNERLQPAPYEQWKAYSEKLGGYGTEEALRRNYEEYVQRVHKVRRSGPDHPLFKEAMKEAEFQVYRQHGGEAEARNVQSRRTLSAASRRRIGPQETEDTPRSDQVITTLRASQQAQRDNAMARAAERARGLLPENAQPKLIADPFGLSDVKMATPWDRVDFSRIADPSVMARREMTPDDLFREMKGGVILPAIGDKSIGGEALTELMGQSMNVPTHGGAAFMRSRSPTGTVWASELPQTSRLSKQVQEAIDKFGSENVLITHSTMGPHGIDFSNHVTDVMLERLPTAKITRAGAKAIKERMAKGLGESTAQGYKYFRYPDFPGINSPKLKSWLDASGRRRKHFIKMMDTAAMQKVGVPNVGEARLAVTDIDQLGVPWFASGRDMSVARPGIIEDAPLPHPSYSRQTPGQYLGGFRDYVTVEDMFPDWWKAVGSHRGNPMRAFELGGVERAQPITQQWLDHLARVRPDLF